MVNAVFDCANRLFGLKFILQSDVTPYHPDVKVYEVFESNDDGSERLVGLFFHDNYARMFKKSGAWMSEFRSQV